MALDFKKNTKELKTKTKLSTKVKIAIGFGGLGSVGFVIWKYFI